MKRFYLLALLVLLILGCGAKGRHSVSREGLFDKYGSREAFLHAIEIGYADADDFVVAVRKGPLRFKDVSPRALANYLEAFANEGMLELIPFYFFQNDEMNVSLDTVFEDPENASINWEVYKDHLRKVQI
ncbi:MAG: hypothetical protein JSW56_05550 [Deltaproteobacteria bacterium]|nr:MAG: hypothetical protein JSW56_05550 [Deltaproteobacteria bacterium]